MHDSDARGLGAGRASLRGSSLPASLRLN